MKADRLLSMLWLIVATAYALRNFAALAAGQGALEDTVPMLTALALAKFYDMDRDDK